MIRFYESEDYKYCLFQSGPEDVDGYGNSVINIKNSKGEITQSLFTFDSHAYLNHDIQDAIRANIIKTDDWRLTGQEDYLLFAKLKEVIPSDYIKTLDNPEYFHEHCEFCMTKPEDNKEQKFYCTLDNYRWICEECYNDFKEKFRFEKL